IESDCGNYDKALSELDKAREFSPGNGRYNALKAQIYYWRGMYEEAETEYRSALSRGFDSEDVRKALGRICYEQLRYDEAVEEFKNALKINPGSGEIHSELSKVYGSKRDFENYARELESAVAKGYEGEEIRIKLAESYRDRGLYSQAVREFRHALRIGAKKDEPWFKNSILNEIELSERKVVLESKPRVLSVVLTNRCNLRCVMCDVGGGKPKDISASLVDSIVEWMPYVEKISWQGGEVFLYGGFKELFEQASSYEHLEQIIITNGLLIDEYWAKRLCSNKVNLNYSIDGFDREVYEGIRTGADYGELLESIDRINSHKGASSGLRMSLRFTVMRSNYKQLGKIVDFAKKHNFDDFTVIYVHPCNVAGRAGDVTVKDDKIKKYVECIIPEIRSRSDSLGIKFQDRISAVTEVNCLHEHGRIALQEQSFLQAEMPEEVIEPVDEVRLLDDECDNHGSFENNGINTFSYCYWPWQHLFINIEDAIKPSCRCRQKIIDISNARSLDSVWNSNGMRDYRDMVGRNEFETLCNTDMSRNECMKSPVSGGPGGILW
ncbi:radical SAM protein, partial [Elusimicrobiota bacterium]